MLWAWLLLTHLVPSLQQTCQLGTQNYTQYQSSCPNPQCTTCLHSSFIAAHVNCTATSCNYITNPQAFQQGCKLSSFYQSLPFYQQGLVHKVWYPARRFIPWGRYEYAAMGQLYGQEIQDEVSWDKDLLDKDCLVLNDGHLMAEDCMEDNRHNCSVALTEFKGFCALTSSFCTESVMCTTASQECPVSTDETCQNCLGVFTYRCSVEMTLTFTRYLFLTVYNPQCIYGRGNSTYIYCFTNAVNMRTRVGVRMVQQHQYYNVYKVTLEELIGEYWCETRDVNDPQQPYVSHTVLAFKSNHGYEFAALISINHICNYTNCTTATVDFNLEVITNKIQDNNFARLRTMQVVTFDTEGISQILYHISTMSYNPGIMADYYKIQRLLASLGQNFTVDALRSSKYCMPEVYRNMSWPLARGNQRVVSTQLCVQTDGCPVTRLCQWGFLWGHHWREVDGECSDFDFGEDTLMLQSMLDLDEFDDGVLTNASDIVRTGNLTLLDMYLISQLLERTVQFNTTSLNASFDVIDALIQSDLTLLQQAQDRMNITDCYLRTTETMSLNATIKSIYKDYVIFHSYDPKNNAGFALYSDLSVRPINNFSDLANIDSVLLSLYITEPDLSLISNLTVIAIIYLNDNLFPSTSSADIVVNLNIPNYDMLLNPLPILVKSDYNKHYNCAFWDYGTTEEPKRGNWSQSGSQYGGFYQNTTLQMCNYSHLTHLALLVIDDRNDTSITDVNDTILSLITAVGSLMSLIGIVGIFVTSCMFRTWRDKLGTQILLHLTVATLFEVFFMYLNGLNSLDCMVAGVVIQYVIISKFAWMLIYAYCQYLRFVRVFGPMPRRLLLKSVLFGWGVALIPTIAVAVTNPQSYHRKNFCYPKGIYLLLGLYLPIFSILLINLFVFCKIMCEVTGKKLERIQNSDLRKQHIRLAVLLFSVLGIPWIFGIIANFVTSQWLKTIMVYVFTIMAIIQGFLMFLFYVIFNKETREAWKGVFMGKSGVYEMFSTSSTKRVTNSVSSISQ